MARYADLTRTESDRKLRRLVAAKIRDRDPRRDLENEVAAEIIALVRENSWEAGGLRNEAMKLKIKLYPLYGRGPLVPMLTDEAGVILPNQRNVRIEGGSADANDCAKVVVTFGVDGDGLAFDFSSEAIREVKAPVETKDYRPVAEDPAAGALKEHASRRVARQ